MNWSEFFKIALAVFLLGLGISLIGNSSGKFIQMILGFISISIGIAIIMSK